MRRRDSILGIIAIGTSGVLGLGGYKWYSLNRPDVKKLDQYRNLIEAVSETIIPKTDSPGAKEAKVWEYIIKMVKESLDKRSQSNFIEGLLKIQEYALDNYSLEFEKCTKIDQEIILKKIENEDQPFKGILGKVEKKVLGKPFFNTIKHLTVEGFVTSQAGATTALAYLPIPGYYAGCEDLKKGQKAWAI